MADTHKYIFVYQTVCEVNGKTYVGVHSTNNINDGYIGGGIYSPGYAKGKQRFHCAVRKYGYTVFRRYILSFYNTIREALDEEAFIVNEKWVKDKSNYNSALGGGGHSLAYLSKEELSKRFKGEKNHRFGKPAHNRKAVLKYDLGGNFLKRFECIVDAANEIGDSGSNISNCCMGNYGQCGGFVYRYDKYTDAQLVKLNNNLSNRKRVYSNDGRFVMSEEHKNTLKGRPGYMLGKKASEETKKKQSAARLGRKTKPCSEDRKRKISEANKGRVFNSEVRLKMSMSRTNSKPILKLNTNGIIISEYASIRLAEREMGIYRNKIKELLSNGCATKCGNYLRYK